MKKEQVVEFFDSLAEKWDDNLIIDNAKLNMILDIAKIDEESTVMDVACGTGVLFPYYIKREVKKIIGVDFSKNMIALAREKYERENTEFYCADIEKFTLEEKVSRIMVFNAFPHFIAPENVIENLQNCINKGGRLTIAHDMGRAQLDKHHSGSAKKVSNGLIPAKELAQMLEKHFIVDTVIDEQEIYIVSGEKR
jgi:demethylmenaquinone methyltransferase/2-methoxy-6-polyprenyl-1,4-benzoquinol methylase